MEAVHSGNEELIMSELLAEFPVIIEIPVAWGEMDAFQHVNNIVYFRYFESGRIAYLERTGLMAAMTEHGVGPILASASCKFKFPLTYPDRVLVGVRVGDIGADRFAMLERQAAAEGRRIHWTTPPAHSCRPIEARFRCRGNR